MELTYPWIMIVGSIVVLLLMIIPFSRRHNEKGITKKVANIDYVRETPYFQHLLQRYRWWKFLLYLFTFLSLIGALFLMSRPVRVTKEEKVEYKKDIFLCLDVSSSMNDINKEIVQAMQKTVQSLSGERFGVVIFDSSPVVLIPLTSDYHYVLDTLIQLEEAFSTSRNGLSFTNDFLTNGTSLREGTSIMSDSLASCAYSFANLEEERSRTILFSTDNNVMGKTILTMEEATDICKELNIKVYAVTPKKVGDEANFVEAIEKTGGEVYKVQDESTVSQVVKKIEEEENAKIDVYEVVHYNDEPLIPFILVCISSITLLVIEKKVEIV